MKEPVPGAQWLDMNRVADAVRGTPPGPAADSMFSAFAMDSPVPVYGWGDFLDCMECAQNGAWYETPISFYDIARLFGVAPHHQSALYFKRNVICSCWQPHPLLTRRTMDGVVLDYLVFGNAYLRVIRNRLGQPIALEHIPAKYTRRGVDLSQYWFIQRDVDDIAFEPGTVCHIANPEIHQEIYGLPEYLAAMMSVYLNSDATLFRRNYFVNGSHAGKLIYVSDALASPAQVEELKNALAGVNGRKAFKNVLVYAAGGKKDGIQILPFSEITAKDDFSHIKDITRNDMLAAHRIPPQLMGIMPNESSGFGDVEKAARVFAINELYPVMTALEYLNEWLGMPVLKFRPYALAEEVKS
ncbi:phage portal protein [Escherichia coli]|uniref:phage portal protein n=1 Tax=Escherichia coli TaxID=562 RepID=UPI00287AB92F|nr:phage portal protein [Escherichia coli]MDS1619831.1 phage portal protein [Escherichia coli]